MAWLFRSGCSSTCSFDLVVRASADLPNSTAATSNRSADIPAPNGAPATGGGSILSAATAPIRTSLPGRRRTPSRSASSTAAAATIPRGGGEQRPRCHRRCRRWRSGGLRGWGKWRKRRQRTGRRGELTYLSFRRIMPNMFWDDFSL